MAHQTRQRGFSLIEVLIALALMAVVLLATTGLATVAMHRAYGGKKMTEAATLAQAVLEAANQPEAQDLIDSTHTSLRTITWTRTSDTAVTPTAEGATADPGKERDRWRTMLLNAPLPATGADPLRMTVRMQAVPAGSTFTTAAMVRITVIVSWTERGTRSRSVELQALNHVTN